MVLGFGGIFDQIDKCVRPFCPYFENNKWIRLVNAGHMTHFNSVKVIIYESFGIRN